MTAPTFNNAAQFYDGSFSDTLTGNFNVGSGSNIGVIALATVHNNSTTITSLVLGGETMMADTAFDLSSIGYTGEYRAFRLPASALTGSQAFTLSLSDPNSRPGVAFMAYADTSEISASTHYQASGYNPSPTLSSDTDSIVAALLSIGTGGTVAADSPTVERLDSNNSNFPQIYGMDEPGASSVTLSATVTGGGTPFSFGPVWNITGTVDPVPPVISDGSATATSPTAATVEFDTDSLSDGDVYVRPRIGGSAASAATIISEGVTQATGGSNPQTVAVTGLTPGSAYHYDIVQDGADGESNVLTVGPVTQWPGLSAATVTLTSDTAADVGVTTTSTGGTLYRYRSSNPTETAGTVKASGDTSTPSGSGAQGPFASTGMTKGLTYYVHWVHNANGGDSAVLSSGPIYPGTWRTTADVTVTGWTASSGSDFFALIDEDTADDDDYITATDISSAQESHFTLSRSAPAGDYTWNVRAAVSSGTGTLRVTMRDGSGNSVGASSDQAITDTPTSYELAVTTTDAATRVSFRLLAD